MQNPLLSVKDLSISFKSDKGYNKVVNNISYQLFPKEILGIVGESGSGKSVSSMALMDLLPKGISHTDQGASIQFNSKELTTLDKNEFRALRGNEISIIFQEPMSSLNPSLRCGKQVVEILLEHTEINRETAQRQTLELFEKVKLPDPHKAFNSYPHQLSGGQKQRVMIAMAIACKPKLLIADEPTTALDVTVQKEIIELLKELQQQTGMSIIFISHDLALVSELADNVIVMYKGEIVESGPTRQLFTSPQHPYTRALLNARPPLDIRLKKLPTIQDYIKGSFMPEIIDPEQRIRDLNSIYNGAPLLEVNNVSKNYLNTLSLFGKNQAFKAVDDVSFKLYEGETLGLVGESGCGKSTLGNTILLLEKASSGSIRYKGEDITHLSSRKLRNLRKEIQIIFQDPYSSLNPRIPVGDAIMEPMKVHKLYNNNRERKEKVMEILEKVGLQASHFHRYPHEFSGGQRQRIGIARTIALNPRLIICDESVSALDISVQAQVLNLLNELKQSFGFTYIFISHDLAVVKYMSDKLLVMNKGKIEETGIADDIYKHPQKAYTRKLIDAIPKGI